MRKMSNIILIFALILGLFSAMIEPAAAAPVPSIPTFAVTSNFSIQDTTAIIPSGYNLVDAQGLPEGKTALLMANYSSSTGYKHQLRVFDQDGTLISSTELSGLMDTRYKSIEVHMLALNDGNVLITYNRSDSSSSNTFTGTVTESRNGAYFIIVNELGQKVVNQTQINTSTGTSLTRSISITQLTGGNIAFSFQRNDNISLATRVFTTAGAAVSSETLLVSANAINSYVAAGNDNTYLVTYNEGSPSNKLWLRQFSSAGVALGAAQDLGSFANTSISMQSLSDGNILFGAYSYSTGGTAARIYSSSGVLQKSFTISNGSINNGGFVVYRNAGEEGFIIGKTDDASTNAINNAYENGYNGNPTNWTGTVYYYFDYYLNDGTFIARTDQPVDSGPGVLQSWNDDWWDYNTYNLPSFFLVSGYEEGLGLITTVNPTTTSYTTYTNLFNMNGSSSPSIPESEPSATVDYVNEELVGLTASGTYTVNGTTVTADGSGKLAIDSSWLGTTLSIVKKGNGTTTSDSTAQSLQVPSRPAAPTGVTATDEMAIGVNDGTLANVATTMEYKKGATGAWTNITGTSVTGLAPDTYY
ncbi:hypothetical protein, partial [Paenibacillus typhae]